MGLNVFKKGNFQYPQLEEQESRYISFVLARVINVSNRTLSDRTRPKILTFKQIFQGLPVAPAQVKASDTSENLLNEIR